ncbi:MAG: hypothetical protein H6Q05_3096 [Acidobacteria bacterium]|nr:hypothetical protein [Acidobacteriota bacterium]
MLNGIMSRLDLVSLTPLFSFVIPNGFGYKAMVSQ